MYSCVCACLIFTVFHLPFASQEITSLGQNPRQIMSTTYGHYPTVVGRRMRMATGQSS